MTVGYICSSCVFASTLLMFAGAAQSVGEGIEVHASGDVVRVTERFVLEESGVVVRVWEKERADGTMGVFYAYEDENGIVGPEQEQKPYLHMRTGSFDPLVESPGVAAGLRADPETEIFIVQFITSPRIEYMNKLKELGASIMPGHLADQARVVRMSSEAKAQVGAMPWVRWIGPVEPEMKIGPNMDMSATDEDGRLSARIGIMPPSMEAQVRLAGVVEDGGGVVSWVSDSGNYIDIFVPNQLVYKLAVSDDCYSVFPKTELVESSAASREAVGADILELVSAESYLDSLGNLVEVAGYSGEGVVGEVVDSRLVLSNCIISDIILDSDPDFPNSSSVIVRSNDNTGGTLDAHGTRVFSVVFAESDDNRPDTRIAGMLPKAQGIFARRDSNGWAGVTDCEVRPLIQEAPDYEVDPSGQTDKDYKAVFQTTSTNSNLGREYNDTSQAVDQIAFSYDILLVRGAGNDGDASGVTLGTIGSAAISKNVLTAGGVSQNSTPNNFSDDEWKSYDCGGAGAPGVGPVDVFGGIGRVKPDLVQFADCIYVPNVFPGPDNPGPVSIGAGVSFATPAIAGAAGLIFEMWGRGYPFVVPQNDPPSGENIFRKTLLSATGDPDVDVFANRPGPAVVKALLINTASPYDWNQDNDDDGVIDDPSDTPNNSITRDVQGWGLPDLVKLYDRAVWYQDSNLNSPHCASSTTGFAPVMHIVPETKIHPTQGMELDHCFEVLSTDTELRVTLVWSDPPPSSLSVPPLVNNLDLKVIAPDGTTVYWGNHGLVDDGDPLTNHGIWSASGGSADTINNVENVFIDELDLQAGMYVVKVILAGINADGDLPVWTGCSTSMPPNNVPPVIDDDMDVKFALVITRGPCVADFNQDGVKDLDDFIAFSAANAAGSPRADINHDGLTNFFDSAPFIAAYTAAYIGDCEKCAGCP